MYRFLVGFSLISFYTLTSGLGGQTRVWNSYHPPVDSFRVSRLIYSQDRMVDCHGVFALGLTAEDARFTPERIKLQKILDSPNSRQELIDWFDEGDLVERLYCMAGFHESFPEEWDKRRYLPIWENQSFGVMWGCIFTRNTAENILMGIELGVSCPEFYKNLSNI